MISFDDDYYTFEREIKSWLFEVFNFRKCKIRVYYEERFGSHIFICEDNFDIFTDLWKKSEEMCDLHVFDDDETAEIEKGDSYKLAVHDHITCDGCLISPIVGFRYNCIQCPKYNLCQNCESKHFHSEHMMVRTSTNNPGDIETHIIGCFARRKHGESSELTHQSIKNNLSVKADSYINADDGASIVPQIAAQKAHQGAVLAAEVAAKVACETVGQVSKCFMDNILTLAAPTFKQPDGNAKEKETTKQKVHVATSLLGGSNDLSNMEIGDIYTDSENNSVSESLNKLDASQEAKANNMVQTTAIQSLIASSVFDLIQLIAAAVTDKIHNPNELEAAVSSATTSKKERSKQKITL